MFHALWVWFFYKKVFHLKEIFMFSNHKRYWQNFGKCTPEPLLINFWRSFFSDKLLSFKKGFGILFVKPASFNIRRIKTEQIILRFSFWRWIFFNNYWKQTLRLANTSNTKFYNQVFHKTQKTLKRGLQQRLDSTAERCVTYLR